MMVAFQAGVGKHLLRLPMEYGRFAYYFFLKSVRLPFLFTIDCCAAMPPGYYHIKFKT